MSDTAFREYLPYTYHHATMVKHFFPQQIQHLLLFVTGQDG